jgi:uncharacterized protein YlxP (DUF503 family)
MHVSSLRLELRVEECTSVRQKRRLLAAISGKLRRHFNISVAEIGLEDRPAEAVLGVVSVAKNRREARVVLTRVADALAAHPLAVVDNFTIFDL